MTKIHLEVYGCSANVSDSEIATGLLRKAGFKIVKNLEEADLNIIFTCIVKTPTANRMIYRIKKLTETGKPLIVAGCMPETEREVIEKINPKASLVGVNSVEKIVDVAKEVLDGKKIVLIRSKPKQKVLLPKVRKNSLIDIIQVAQGCLGACSFCETRFARGRLFSYNQEAIIKEIKKALVEGCKEIWLTSQDNSAYGLDSNTNIVELLNKIISIKGEFFVRIGMMNPLHLKRLDLGKLIEIFKDSKIFKFLHLPVQSGSDKVLCDMNRGYTSSDFLNIVSEFRKEIPKLTLATDIIVGFPTESDEDFKETIKLIKSVKPDVVNISRYSQRPGTPAANLKQIDPIIIKKRSTLISEITRKISLERNKKWINWEGYVLVDEKTDNFVGRNQFYKSIVITSNENLFGKVVKVKITGVRPSCLLGKLIKK